MLKLCHLGDAHFNLDVAVNEDVPTNIDRKYELIYIILTRRSLWKDHLNLILPTCRN